MTTVKRGNGTFVLRTPDESGSGLHIFTCPDCGEPASTGLRQVWHPFPAKVAIQRCGCGEIRLTAHRDKPVMIPPEMIEGAAPNFQRRQCACGDWFHFRPRDPQTHCGRCRHKAGVAAACVIRTCPCGATFRTFKSRKLTTCRKCRNRESAKRAQAIRNSRLVEATCACGRVFRTRGADPRSRCVPCRNRGWSAEYVRSKRAA